jgi:DNA-binding beta-propeller fold protein YncE
MIDAATDKRVGDFTIGVHPESFQLEKSGTRIFVNLADSNQIAVVDRKTRAVTKWPLKGLASNFPMALVRNISAYSSVLACRPGLPSWIRSLAM